MDAKLKELTANRLQQAHARAQKQIEKLEIDARGEKLTHQLERISSLLVYHLKAKATARLALEELDKL